MSVSKYEKVIDYAIRRGFIWQSYEIYGGQSGFYDLGPLGVLLKNNIVDLWREYFVKQHQDFVVEIETPIITPAIVFRASGHEENFTDYAVECLSCHRVYRADHLVEEILKISAEGLTGEQLDEIIEKNNIRCPVCKGSLSKTRKFLLLFQTYIGPYTPENLAYLRPEAAQGMFINFKRVYELMRRRLPLGIAQIGRVARNEISPRQGPIRLREFTIMEIEFFYDDKDPRCDILYERCSDRKIRILTAQQRERGDDKPIEISVVEAYKEGFIKSPWLAYWMCIAHNFISAIGVPEDKTYFEEKLPTERAHYSQQTFDQMVIVDKWGKLEVSGHAYRHTYDIDRHIRFSNADLYAIRQLPSPRIERKRRVKIDKTLIIKIFGSRAGEVFKALYSLGEDRLAEIVEKTPGDRIMLNDGIEIPKNILKIEEVEEQIWTERFIPHVAEPSFGAERLLYIALEYAYTEDEGRIILKFPKRIAPIKIAITPLVDREPLTNVAVNIYKTLKQYYYSIYIEGGSIGKKYAYADELGIPYVVTVDYESIERADATIRDRDTRKQIRVPINELTRVLDMALKGEDIFSLGYPIINN
ncbi:glycyl-tRNA synthetase [Ignisphaera aggregans DSM 17230]|uniref:glycine--tRNA ligase n=1 Tax=Ignisphaera aggregans (strain DSM 17230 / JCM 13409 / AQ1.S1) TaxID=583356 RepID=E0SQ52_IGNAA|nr:glycyl-tRNA synthetase [Ignisphaera aggregans DSM 17230]